MGGGSCFGSVPLIKGMGKSRSHDSQGAKLVIWGHKLRGKMPQKGCTIYVLRNFGLFVRWLLCDQNLIVCEGAII